jgi:EpsI family protein
VALVTRQGRFVLVTVALFVLTGTALALPRAARDIPLPLPLDAIPTVIGDWRPAPPPPDEILPRDPRAADNLVRGYTDGTRTTWVAVGYYPNQTDTRRPATGNLVYPSSGWTDLSSETVSIPLTGAPALPANLVLVRREDRLVVILYWYQLPGGTIGSDHLYRARLMWNRIVHRRADGALVRIAAPLPTGGSRAQVIAQQTEFLRAFLPELSRSLPR